MPDSPLRRSPPPTTLDDVASALLARFPPEVVKHRTGPVWERDGARWTQPLSYIDARAVFDRLDAVVGPSGWSTDIIPVAPGVYLCRLTVHGVTKADIGQAGEREVERDKAGVSDAIKRAAVQFGIGRYLYANENPPVRLEKRGNDWVLPRGWCPPPAAVAPQMTIAGTPSSVRAPETNAVVARRMATPAQVRKIEAEAAWRGLSDEYLDHHLQGRRPTDLTCTEASRVIEQLIALAPRRPEAG